MRRRRTLIFAALTAGAALTTAACGSSKSTGSPTPATTGGAATSGAATSGAASSGGGAGAGKTIHVASANFDESLILAQVYGQALAAKGYTVDYKELTTRPVINQAMETGQIDLTPEYVGSLTIFENKKVNGPDAKKISSSDPEATKTALQPLLAKQKLQALAISPASDENSYAVTQDFSTKNNIKSLSDLGAYKGGKLTIGGTAECRTYDGCLPGLKREYGINATLKIEKLQSPLLVQDLKQGKVQFAEYLSSDPTIQTEGLTLLTDDKKLQDADNIVPVVRTEVATPDLTALVDKVSAALSLNDLIGLNKSVSVDKMDAATAAKGFLTSKGLL